MNALQKLISRVNKLEEQLAGDIAKVAAELEPLPDDRDTAALEIAWGGATSTRRKLANCLKDGLRQIKATEGKGIQLNAARKDLKAAKSRLRIWARMDSIVRSQLLCEPRELVPLQDVEVLDQVVELFFDSMHKIANPAAVKQGGDAKSHGHYHDIPYAMSLFSKMIGAAFRICLALKRERPLRFLDVGSGGGTKVLAATARFDVCHGLEYQKEAVTTGRGFLKMLDLEQCKLIRGDALEFLNYGDYDVIYFYRPLREREKMVQMEERIFAQAQPGTVILAGDGLFADDLPDKGVHELANHIYVTGRTKDEALEIGKTAEQMGLMAPSLGRTKVSRLGYWTPLLEVSARNGYYL